MPEKGECLKFKNFVRRIKPLFMIYANFKSTLFPEIMEMESYTNKYKKHVACRL